VVTSNSLRLFSAEEPSWLEYLAQVRHDFFHTAEYHSLAQIREGGKAWLAVYGDADKFVAWPYLLQEIKIDGTALGFCDATCVYGYSGPLTHNCSEDKEFLTRMWAALVDVWRSQRVVSVFSRFHPVLQNQQWVSACTGHNALGVQGGLYAQGCIVVVPLAGPPADPWKGYKPHLRRDLNRCMRGALLSTPDPEWANLDEFIRLYHLTMARNHASQFYFFDRKYFQALRQRLGTHGSLMITRLGEHVAAAALLIEYFGIVHLHLLASDDRFANLSPSKLTIHDAANWARSRGNQLLVLGGGRAARDDDSLFRFKARFSETHYPFCTGRWILDRSTYQFLAEQRGRRDNDLTADQYFPAYRVPMAEKELPPPSRVKSHDGVLKVQTV
jgi:hypothetical protein